MEWIESIDRSIVLWVNGWHSPMLDKFMWIISAKLTWVPLYVLILILFIRSYNWKKGIVFLLAVIICVTLTDQISVHLFKDLFQRYRPSHHSLLTDRLHFYSLGNGNFYKGGMYGFVSSHAANFAGVCFFAMIQLRKSYSWLSYLLILILLLVCFSRIYLGVHYLSDVTVGVALGGLIALIVNRFIFKPVINKYF
jgi:undecaprenyl-diphosphatase